MIEERSETQAVEGYGCICGFQIEDKKEFTDHLLFAGKRDGKGVHKSLGRVNLLTGEKILPPWSERSGQEKSDTRYAKKVRGRTRKSDEERIVKTTDVLGKAQEIRFVPRVYTADYTPIMRAAQVAATREWGWRDDMPLENFLDTIIYHAFKDRGITLAGYIVEKEEVKEDASRGY